MKLIRTLTIIACLGVAACSSLPEHIQAPPSYAISDSADTRLAKFSQPIMQQWQPDQSGFRPLGDGVEALLARLALADMADKTLDVQYYIWHDDLTGRHFANALLKAADRGVRVRVILDDLGANADDDILAAIDLHPNIEIRLFNPVASRTFRGLSMLSDFSRVNRRMHNKAFIADNQAAIVGGRNIGDEYFDASGDVAFGDLDLISVGPVVRQVSNAFDRYWNSRSVVPIAALHTVDEAQLTKLRADLSAFVQDQRQSTYVQQSLSYLNEKMAAGPDKLFRGQAVVDRNTKFSIQ